MKKSTFLRVFSMALLVAGGSASGQVQNLTKVDINNPVVSTLATNGDGSITVTAGGNDTWGNEDSFTYLYEQKTGDFDVRVQILDLQVDDPAQQDSAKASLHARVSLVPGAADVMINGTPEAGANYVETIFRPALGVGTDDPPINGFEKKYGDGPWDGTFRPTGGGHLYYPPDVVSTWFRMRRVKNMINVYYSQDGWTWQMLADYTLDPVNFPATIYVGLSTAAHIDPATENTNNRVRATYANYGPTPAPKPNISGTPVPADAAPGVYPTASVSSINWNLQIPANGKAPNGDFITYNAGNKNEIILTIDGEGPIYWAAPGYNQGDLDFSLAPRDPVAATQPGNLGPYSNPNRNISVTDPASPVTQAWIPSSRQGLVIGSIRKNGQQWNDDGAGGPTSRFHSFCSVSIDYSSRLGFGMDNGQWQNGEFYFSIYKFGENDPTLPTASNPWALREANINVAMAWFPFDQGWKAGYIGDATMAPDAFWRKQGSHSAAVVEGTAAINKVSSKAIFKWEDPGTGVYGGLGRLTLPGVDATKDGMVFCASNDDQSNNEGQYLTAAPYDDGTAKGWLVSMRQDDTYVYSDPDRSEFGFVYIPYTAGNLIGGQVKGTDGSKLHGAGSYSIVRLAAGQYEITLPGKTGLDGVLLLQASGYLASNPVEPDNTVLTYEYTQTNKFVVESRYVSSGTGPQGMDETPLRDADFYFAWLDFKNPLTPSAVVVVPAFNPPVLNKDGLLTISWTGTGTLLQSTNAALPMAQWTTVPGSPTSPYNVTPATGAPRTYYRLRQ
ncbi:MAG: hypothetical protein WCQ21_09710 [Verrucomicrobiota bacterium]